jgi:hypothetical protein
MAECTNDIIKNTKPASTFNVSDFFGCILISQMETVEALTQIDSQVIDYYSKNLK